MAHLIAIDRVKVLMSSPAAMKEYREMRRRNKHSLAAKAMAEQHRRSLGHGG